MKPLLIILYPDAQGSGFEASFENDTTKWPEIKGAIRTGDTLSGTLRSLAEAVARLQEEWQFGQFNDEATT